MIEEFKMVYKHLEWWEGPFVVFMSGIIVAAMIEDYNIWQPTALVWVLVAFIHRLSNAFLERACRDLVAINEKQTELLNELLDKLDNARR